MKRYLPFAIIAMVLVIALAGGFFFYRSSQQTKPPSESFTESSPTPTPASQTGQPAPTPVVQQAPNDYTGAHARGGANAKATIEEYGDYQCPPCGALFHDLKALEKEYGEEMRFVFRHYPLPSIHKHAIAAAQAAEAAGLQGKFWEMHDMLYQNQLSWSPVDDVRPVFLQYASALKLDIDRFTRDMESPQVMARIRADSARGSASKVEGTPTIFINGRQLRPEAVTQEGLRMALDYVLGKKR